MAPKAKSAATATKPRSSAAPKYKGSPKLSKAKGKITAQVNSPDSPPPADSLDLSKALVLRIIIAKLESSKSCDWYQLSQKLDAEGITDKGKANGKGKAGAANKPAVFSGSDLHDIYHNKILPGLKSGRALWAEDDDGEIVPQVVGAQLTLDAMFKAPAKGTKVNGESRVKSKPRSKIKDRIMENDDETDEDAYTSANTSVDISADTLSHDISADNILSGESEGEGEESDEENEEYGEEYEEEEDE